MIWNIQEFNKETEALKKLSSESDLNPLRKEAIKRNIFEAISETSNTSQRLNVLERKHSMSFIISALVGIFALGGTAFAAHGSLPGDTLYPLKQAQEVLKVRLATNTEAEAQTRVEIAQKKIEELAKIHAQKEQASNDKEKEDLDKKEDKSENEVSHAIETLTKVQAKLETKGNATAAAAVKENIARLKAKATITTTTEDKVKTENEDKTEVHGKSKANVKVEDKYKEAEEEND